MDTSGVVGSLERQPRRGIPGYAAPFADFVGVLEDGKDDRFPPQDGGT